jgi:hypothetical protein
VTVTEIGLWGLIVTLVAWVATRVHRKKMQMVRVRQRPDEQDRK